MYLISAYFDQRTTKNLQKYIDRIAQEAGNTFMTQNHVPPHMTISAIEARNVDVLPVLNRCLSQSDKTPTSASGE